ncbi:MAG: YbfB/YjiJ family MFS transporter [Vulcanimicrobiaceae bacterium]
MVTNLERPFLAAEAVVGRRPRRLVLILWSSVIFGLQIGVARLGYGLALPAIRQALHGNYAAYGAVNAVSLGGYLAGALIAPLLMRRVPRLVLWASVAAGAALAASALVGDVVWLGVARTAFGVASGVTLVAAAVETLESVAPTYRGTASALMWAGTGVGMALSALGTAWLLHDAMAWRAASLVSGVLILGAAIGYSAVAHGAASLARTRTALTPNVSARFDVRDLLRPRRFLFLCLAYAAFGFAYIAYATFIVASLEARLGPAHATASITLLWGLYGVANVLGALSVARLLDGRFRRSALAVAGFAGVIGCFVAVAWPHGAALSAILVGLGLAATPAAATAYARARSTVAGAPAAISAVTVAVGLGQLVGPLAAGLAADVLGLPSVAFVAGCAYVLGTLFAVADAFAVREPAA